MESKSFELLVKEKGREGSRPRSSLEMQAYVACWVEWRLAVWRKEIRSGLLHGRRGEVNIGWNNVQTRLEDFSFALSGT